MNSKQLRAQYTKMYSLHTGLSDFQNGWLDRPPPVSFLAVLCPSLLPFYPSSFSPWLPVCCWIISHYLSFDFLLVNLGWSFIRRLDDTLHSNAEDVGGGGGGTTHNWGSLRTLSSSTWANTESARGGRETSRTNWRRSPGGVTADVQQH